MSDQETSTAVPMINFVIDGAPLTVPKGTTVYNAAKHLGIEIPVFCYLDRMPPFGACRMCLVEVEKMGKLQTACTLEATEGMVVRTQSTMAEEGRKDIIEFLLINHPLDCPICDRGGECPLQDNALRYGPGLSRFFEEKRHFKKALALSPVLMLDRERCIVCARCTRFSDLLSGDHALEFIERGYKTEVGTSHDKASDGKFIGNTIMICPVGALTSNVYRFRARPWDNDSEDTTCTLCPVGCSMTLDARDGEIMRTRSSENRQVNDIWMCDKGWFGYEFSSHPDRLQHPLIRRKGKLEPADWDEALSLIAEKIKEAKPSKKLAGWGGNPLTTEENYLFQQLVREGFGVNHADHRIGTPIRTFDEEGIPPGMEIEIGECESLSYAFLLGIDLTEELPVVWLRLRQAINSGAKVIFIGHYAPEISPHLSKTIVHQPGEELEVIKNQMDKLLDLSVIGKKGALFVGRQYLNSPQRLLILEELLKIKSSATGLSLNIMEGDGNSIGARLGGMRPDTGPLNKKIESSGLNAIQVLETAANDGWEFLYVAGANPALKYPTSLWKKARSRLNFLVVQDLFLNETAQEADVVLPALCFMEKSGTFVNIDGHMQRLKPGKELPKGILRGDGEIFSRIGQKLGISMELDHSFIKKLETDRYAWHIPLEVKAKKNDSFSTLGERELYATFAPTLFDKGVRMQHNPHLLCLVKPPSIRIHPLEGERLGVKEGESVKIESQEATINALVKYDKGVADKTVVLPLGFPEVPVQCLGLNIQNGIKVKILRDDSHGS